MGDRGPGGSSGSTVGCAVYVDSVKAMAESVGIANLNDEAAKVLAEDITYRIRNILQDALKFMEKGKRRKLTTQDFDYALKVKNIEVRLRILT
jgi:transcription initiation factor TFIID subunit 6